MKASINWHEGFANDPDLEVHVDQSLAEVVQQHKELEYEQRGSAYFACDPETGVARYFWYNGPGDGYGGAHFTLKMRDGSTKVLEGPWSSRSSFMNRVGFPHSVEVTYVLPSGGRLAGAMLIEKAREYLRATGEQVEYQLIGEDDEPRYVIVRTGEENQS